MARQFLDEEAVAEGCSPNFPVDFQRESLGLDKAYLERLKGKKVLDIACGSEARLVCCLRQKGIDAEGIDPVVNPNGHIYLMGQMVCPGSPIPRENDSYDLVVAHSFPLLDQAFSNYVFLASYLPNFVGGAQRAIGPAQYVLEEALRVMKKSGGRFVTNPAVDGLRDFGEVLKGRGYKITHIPFTRTSKFADVADEKYRELSRTLGVPLDAFKFLNTRTVIRYAGD